VTSMSTEDDEKLGMGRVVAAIVFALLALTFFVIAVLYLTMPDDKLPGFLGYAHSRQHHALRGVGSVLLALLFTVAAWFALRYQSLALEEAHEAGQAPAGQTEATQVVVETAQAIQPVIAAQPERQEDSGQPAAAG
jgi:hypothetical protein